MIFTNISTPLLGIVDTAVLGHLDSEHFLGAVAIGGLVFSFIFWGFGFLRMGTTGLTAQAYGNNKQGEINAILIRALILALVISGVITAFSQPIGWLSFWLIQSGVVVEQLALQYFEIRVLSTPATLSVYVLMGWFIGRQNVRIPLFIVLSTNVSNIILDLLFVYYFNMQVAGVALASVVAEYIGFTVSLIVALRVIRKQKPDWNWGSIFSYNKLKAMLVINSHIFVRTWCLIFAFAFFTAQGARMGDVVLAANAVLLNFQSFMAYALDGFAHAAEALVGKAVGGGNKTKIRQSIVTAGFWSVLIAIVFAVFYVLFGKLLVDLLTGLTQVRTTAYIYLPWVMLMPLVSFVCYLLDGIFIGAMMTKEMKNTMLLSLFCVFLPVWYFTQTMANHGLWLSMVLFMVARSLSMFIVFKKSRLLEPK